VLSLSVKLGQERDLKYKPLGAAHVGVQATWHNGNHIRTCTLISDNMHDLCVMCVGTALQEFYAWVQWTNGVWPASSTGSTSRRTQNGQGREGDARADQACRSMGLQRINKPHTRARRRCTLHVGTELRYDVRRGRQETSAADRAPAGAWN